LHDYLEGLRKARLSLPAAATDERFHAEQTRGGAQRCGLMAADTSQQVDAMVHFDTTQPVQSLHSDVMLQRSESIGNLFNGRWARDSRFKTDGTRKKPRPSGQG